MARKIRFPLRMKNGAEVRTLDELKENFDLESVLGYFTDGKLQTWLADRYYDEKAEAVAGLSADTPDLNAKLCEILEVEYKAEADETDLEYIRRRNEKLKILGAVTADQDILKNIDLVAMDQDELYDILYESPENVYLYDGYDCYGKQIERFMTWKPKEGMSDKQIEKELQRQIVMFEDAVKEGLYFDSNMRFGDYGEEWLEMNRPPQLAPKTYECYKGMFRDIKEALGHIKLIKLQSRHLQMFYSNLRENGVKRTGAYAVSEKIDDIRKEMHLSKDKFAELCGVSSTTISAVCKPDGHISIKSAEKIAEGLNISVQKLFELHLDTGGLSDKTVLHYHKLISTILAQATRDRLIPFNIADRNHMKAPKLERKEAVFLDDEQVRHVLELLENEPIKWKTIMYLLIYSGIRRGELLGLEWKDIDFEKKVIYIRRTSQAVDHMGIITKSPKNDTSYRTIKLSDTMLDQLREYKQYWLKRRTELDDYWQDNIQIILADGSTQTVPNDRLFTKVDSTPMNPYSVSDWVRKFVKRNNLPYFTPHSLRHTHATLLIAEGVSIPTVSRRLGHSSIATTSKIYIHAIQSADEIASNALEDKLKLEKHKEDED